MLLAIDVGNTETVLGLYPLAGAGAQGEDHDQDPRGRGELAHHWRIASVAARTPDEHAVVLRSLFDLANSWEPSIEGIAICSSMPVVTAALRQMAATWFRGVPCVVVGPGARSGMPILYEDPREVGPDRIADAVGAYHLYGGPVVVVDLGTATTVEAVSKSGEYLGGAISPGVAISVDALFAQAAGLRPVPLLAPRSVIGRTPAESIQAGVLYGFGSLVDGLVERVIAELGESPVAVVATGGLAELVAPYATRVDQVEPWLTLEGLRVLYARNAPGPRPL
ncbi:MAG: type III pantothenate kinase [Acidimicrobiales bacterium]